jgi:hypothetical protein
LEGLDDLIAKQEIREVLMRFCRGVDRGDIDLVRSCYHPDAEDDHGAYRGGIDGLCEAVQQMVDRTSVTHHVLGQALIEVDGQEARSECYVIAYHRTRPHAGSAEHDVLVGARYLDLFERRAGSWRISRRTVSHAWSRRTPSQRWAGGSKMAQDARAPDDLLYLLGFAELSQHPAP